MAQDSASIGLDGTRYRSLTERLDAEAAAGGGRGWTVASFNDDSDIDLGASLDEGFSMVVVVPSSPPSAAIVLPSNDRPPFMLVLLGAHPSDFSYVYEGVPFDASSIFHPGEFSIDDTRLFHMIQNPADSGWAAFPVISAEGLTPSTYTLQVTVADGEIPAWFLGD